KLKPHNHHNRVPECHQLAARGQLGRRQSRKVHPKMKHHSVSEPAPPAPTLQDVVDLVAGNPDLSETRRRDLRSAVVTYGKVVGEPLSTIPMDLAAIRKTLDGVVPMQAKVSRKRWANLRSDLAAA